MCQDVRATRSAPQCTARTTVDARRYTVWLQEVYRFSETAQHNTLIRTGAQERLQEIFDQVAGRPRRIRIRWIAINAPDCVRNNEIAIYFVQDYSHGIIRPWLRARIRATRGEDRRAIEDVESRIRASTEAGLTLMDQDMSFSEVYIDACLDAVPADREATNYDALLRTSVGRMMGNMAFHEAMHNKIDPTHANTWDLHASGGSGLAIAAINDRTNYTTQNTRQMRTVLRRRRRQYVHGQTQLPTRSTAP